MNLRIIGKFFFGSLRNISSIEYKAKNLEMLPKAMELAPNKE